MGPPSRGITGVPGGVGEPGGAPGTPPRAQPQAGCSQAWPGLGAQTPPPKAVPEEHQAGRAQSRPALGLPHQLL